MKVLMQESFPNQDSLNCKVKLVLMPVVSCKRFPDGLGKKMKYREMVVWVEIKSRTGL